MEWTDENVKNDIRKLNQKIIESIGDVQLPDLPITLQDEYDIYEPMEPEATKPEIGDFTPEAYDYDAFIFAKLVLPKGDIMLPAKVVARKRDADGNSVGIANANPIHGTNLCSSIPRLNHMLLISLKKICMYMWIMKATNSYCWKKLLITALMNVP